MIFGVEGINPDRRQLLIDLLDIDLSWRLNRVSDGQRRRVQICLGLLKPYKVILRSATRRLCAKLGPHALQCLPEGLAKQLMTSFRSNLAHT